MALNKGDVFESFKQFELMLKAFQASNTVLFTRKSSKKLPSYHPDAERLQYEFVHFECKQGKKRNTLSKGIRPNQRTLKLNCEAYMRISTCETGGKISLKITGADHSHSNHPVDAMTAAVYPENRRPVATETVRAMASAHVSQRQLKQYLEDSQSVCLLPQDVSNLKRKLTGGSGRMNDSESVERVLENVRREGGFTKFGMTENGEFEYGFFMSASMKSDLDRFCDVFVMDVTYKVNRYLYPLVNVLCIDAEGGGRPVFHGFVRNESQASLMSCLSFLKSVMSEDVCGPSVFFVDKDLSEIAAIHEIFPAALVRLCSFHSSVAVKRALTSHGLSSQQVDTFLDVFKEQRDTRSQERFHELTDIILRDAPDKTVDYFRKYWWSITDMWAAHAVLDLQTFHVTTTNHVESYHSKIKQTLHPQTRLTDCISTLLTYNSHLVKTKDLNSHLHNISRQYNVTQLDKDLENITDLLTSFASKLITDQYQLAKKITYIHTQTPSCSAQTTDIFQVTGETTQRNSYKTTVDTCNCSFFCRFKLTCRHIFSLKTYLGLPLYSSDMFAGSRFLKSSQFPADDRPSLILQHAAELLPCRRITNTQEGRFRVVSAVTNRLNAVYQMMGEEQFNHRIEQLEEFLSLVTADKDFSIVDMSVDRTAPPLSVRTEPTLSDETEPTLSDETETLSSDRTETPSSDETETPSSDRTEPTPSDETETPFSDMPFVTPSSDSTVPSSDLTFASVHLQKVKTRGRPRNKQNFTRRKRRKIDNDILATGSMTEETAAVDTTPLTLSDTVTMTVCDASSSTVSLPITTEPNCTVVENCVDIVESVCHICGEEELVRSLCVNGVMEWVRCKDCPRWYHKYCLGDVRVRTFVCSFCLPGAIVQMKEMLSDCMHNISIMGSN